MKILPISNYQNQPKFGTGTFRVKTAQGWVAHAVENLGHVSERTVFAQGGAKHYVLVSQKAASNEAPAIITLDAKDSETQAIIAQELRAAIRDAVNGNEVRFDSIG